MKKAALTLGLCLFAVVAHGQSRPGYSGFSLSTPLQISAGTDTNFLIDRTTPFERIFYLSFPATVQRETPLSQSKQFDDKVLLVNAPTFSYVRDSRRSGFSINYRPEFEVFRVNEDQNSWNHDASLTYSYSLSRRTLLVIGDTFRSSQDPGRTMQNVFLLLPRDRYKSNAFRTSVTHELSERTTVDLRFDHTIMKFGNVDPFQVRVLDTATAGVSLSATRMLSQTQRVRGTYSVLKTKTLDRQGEGDDVVDADRHEFTWPAQSGKVDYRIALTPGFVLELTGGLVHAEGTNTSVFGAAADKRFGNFWIGGGYSRSMAFLAGGSRVIADGLKSNDVYEVVRFRFGGQITQRLGIDLSVTGSQGVASAIVAESKSALGTGILNYRWTERISTFFTAENYQQNQNEYVNEPLSRTRLLVGLEYSFSDDSERRISRIDRDAEYLDLMETIRPR